MFDVVVVGGGPAGLSAALMLGRCRRRVLICDEGRPRNRRTHAVHGFLTRDGTRPDRMTALGRAELEPYGVEQRAIAVAGATRTNEGFSVTLADGRVERAKYLLLATGVEDDLPRIPGIEACYGTSVFHCPYCDGWEHRDRRIAVLGRDRGGMQLALSMRTWSRDIILCTDGTPLSARARQRLTRNAVGYATEQVRRCVHTDARVTELEFDGRDPIACEAIFFTTGQRPGCRLAEELGCAFNRKGTVQTSLLGETNVPGVFVAGDASHDAQFVIVAAAEGTKAALAINQSLQRGELLP
jgi:thioredoxin reductase